MSKWSLDFTPEAEDDLERLDKNLQKRIGEKLEWLQDNFDKIIPSALGSEWRGFFKLRVGDWRVIYKVKWDKNQIIIYVIDRRDKIYKRKKF
jgi:mRNA interferase RelE/StbE